MNYKQGGSRSMPDGFVHIQNFTVTGASGVAGPVWRLMSRDQKKIVEAILIERAIALEESAGPEWTHASHHFKHGQWRFRKAFLKSHFSLVVVEALRLCKVDPAAILAVRWKELQVTR